jgi:hypothetical protein
VRFQLWEGGGPAEIGTAYIAGSGWKLYRFPFKSSGGGRLLTVDVLNAGKDGRPGPEVEFGPLKMKSSE